MRYHGDNIPIVSERSKSRGVLSQCCRVTKTVTENQIVSAKNNLRFLLSKTVLRQRQKMDPVKFDITRFEATRGISAFGLSRRYCLKGRINFHRARQIGLPLNTGIVQWSKHDLIVYSTPYEIGMAWIYFRCCSCWVIVFALMALSVTKIRQYGDITFQCVVILMCPVVSHPNCIMKYWMEEVTCNGMTVSPFTNMV